MPKRATAAEAALVGRPWTRGHVDGGDGGAGDEFSPLTDMRASADYRRLVAKNLLLRFWLETTSRGRRCGCRNGRSRMNILTP